MTETWIHWLTLIGWFTDKAFPGVECYAEGATFWSMPLGLAVSLILALAGAVRVMVPEARDHFFDTLYFALVSLLFFSAFAIGLTPGSEPHYIVKALLTLLAFRAVWRVLKNYSRKRAHARY